MSLKREAIGGVKWTTAATSLTTALHFLRVAVLARFLEPVDFGLMAIVMVVIGFSQAFSDLGISNAIIHRQNITNSQLSSLYWLNILSGFILTAIIIIGAPFLALFFDDARLSGLTMIVATVFVITAIGKQFHILCQKEMQFSTIAKVTISAEMVATVVAIALAVNGYGVYALVYSTLVAALVTSIAFLIVGMIRHHRPAISFRRDELSGFLRFGLYQMGERSVNYLSTHMDKILIGKLVGMDAVGFYNLAWQLIIFPVSKINPIVNAVAFPAYAKVQQDFAALSRYYTVGVKMLSLVTIPLLAFLFFFAEDAVQLAFGSHWEQTVGLVRILVVIGIVRALGNPGGALLLALGRADVCFWWNLFWAFLVTAGLMVSLLLWPRVEIAAFTLLGLTLTVGVVWHVIVARVGKLDYWPIARHFARVFTFAVGGGGIARMAVEWLGLEGLLSRLSLAVVICVPFYIAYLYSFERKLLSQLAR